MASHVCQWMDKYVGFEHIDALVLKHIILNQMSSDSRASPSNNF